MSFDVTNFLQQVFNAMSLASIYALVGIGITLVFGLTKLVNFSHGEFVMVGAILLLVLVQDSGINFYIAILVAVVIVSAISTILYFSLFRPTINAPLNGFIVSLGLILVIQGITVELWGPYTKALIPPFRGVIDLGGVRLAEQRIFTITAAITILGALFYFLKYTKIGVAMRCVAEDREVASWMGIPVSMMMALTFAMGGALAAIAGGLIAALLPVNYLVGEKFIVKGFAVALLGGLGNAAGALVAALIIASVETAVTAYFLSQWTDGFAFGMIVLVLLVRPSGLFRGTEGGGL